MDFFKTLSEQIGDKDILTLVIAKRGENLSVSLLPKHADLKDEAQEKICPMLLSGTAEELDNGFFPAIQQPLAQTVGLLTNMAEHEKSLEAAKAASKAESGAKKKEDTERRTYAERIKKVETLLGEKKFSEASTLLKTAAAMSCADSKQCEKLKYDIEVEMNSGTLFGE